MQLQTQENRVVVGGKKLDAREHVEQEGGVVGCVISMKSAHAPHRVNIGAAPERSAPCMQLARGARSPEDFENRKELYK